MSLIMINNQLLTKSIDKQLIKITQKNQLINN